MRRVLCAVLAVTLGTTIAAAQNTTIIKERKEHFKKMGDTAKPANAARRMSLPFARFEHWIAHMLSFPEFRAHTPRALLPSR